MIAVCILHTIGKVKSFARNDLNQYLSLLEPTNSKFEKAVGKTKGVCWTKRGKNMYFHRFTWFNKSTGRSNVRIEERCRAVKILTCVLNLLFW